MKLSVKVIVKTMLGFAFVLGLCVNLPAATDPAPAAAKTPAQPPSSSAPKVLLPPLPAVAPDTLEPGTVYLGPVGPGTVGPGPNAGANPGNEPLHDPTAPSPMMKQLMDRPKNAQGKPPEIPVIELKARIIGGLQPGVAVLAIDKQIYVVNKDSEFTLTGPKYGNQKVRVTELDADVVRLEIQPTNMSVTLR